MHDCLRIQVPAIILHDSSTSSNGEQTLLHVSQSTLSGCLHACEVSKEHRGEVAVGEVPGTFTLPHLNVLPAVHFAKQDIETINEGSCLQPLGTCITKQID